MNLVPSMTEPPPTANRKSTFSLRTISTAFISVSYLGLASMPENSMNSKASNALTTCW